MDATFREKINRVLPESVDAVLAVQSTHSKTNHLPGDDSFTEEQIVHQNLNRMLGERKITTSVYLPSDGKTSSEERRCILAQAVKDHAEEIELWTRSFGLGERYYASAPSYDHDDDLNILQETERECGIATVFDSKTGYFHSFAVKNVSLWLMPYGGGDLHCCLETDYPAFSKEKTYIPTEKESRLIKRESIDDVFGRLSDRHSILDRYSFVVKAENNKRCHADKKYDAYTGRDVLVIFHETKNGKVTLYFGEDGLHNAKLRPIDGDRTVYLKTREERDAIKDEYPAARSVVIKYKKMFERTENNTLSEYYIAKQQATQTSSPAKQIFGEKGARKNCQNLTNSPTGAIVKP